MTKAELAEHVLEACARLEALAKEALAKEGAKTDDAIHLYPRAFGRLEMAVEMECATLRALVAGEGRSR